MIKFILLSFDVEEFDLPEEYGIKISDKEKIKISLEGLKKILFLLDELKIKATFFIIANFAEKNPEIIREISKNHEIASHGFIHSSISEDDLKKSKIFLENVIKKKILGFRAPRLVKINENKITKAGYLYDSSVNPTYIPGRYNNFFKKRIAHYSKNLFIIPISVTPLIRFPLFWLSFKNFPLSFIKLASKRVLKKDRYINVYFHPWEFSDISKFKLPFYIKEYSGQKMLNKLKIYLIWLKKQGRFVTFGEFKDNLDKSLSPPPRSPYPEPYLE